MGLSLDRLIGIPCFYTTTPGIGGVLRQELYDFQVEEISKLPRLREKGRYLVVELTKQRWDTHLLVKRASRMLGISRERFSWAGTKDKWAVTKQLISIQGLKTGELEKIKITDAHFKPLGYSDHKIGLGSLWGNKFKITVRNIHLDTEEVEGRLEAIKSELEKLGGVPNFYGTQRFGESRPVTHLVGMAMVKGDLRQAVEIYTSMVFPDESEEAREARTYLKETGDYRGTLKILPPGLGFERSIIQHLIEKPGDYQGALRALPLNLRRLFVHGYQSYIFNQILAKRIEMGLPLNQAVEGDIVCFKNQMGLPDTHKIQKATRKNLDGLNRLIRLHRAFVTAPLPGYETPLAEGKPGEIERSFLKEKDNFKIPEMPELASRGGRREIALPPGLEYRLEQDDLNPNKTKTTLEFKLPKGAYATTFLREYIKYTE